MADFVDAGCSGWFLLVDVARFFRAVPFRETGRCRLGFLWSARSVGACRHRDGWQQTGGDKHAVGMALRCRAVFAASSNDDSVFEDWISENRAGGFDGSGVLWNLAARILVPIQSEGV